MITQERPPQAHAFWLAVALLATLAIALALRLVLLDSLPGEIYGDIVIVYDYTAEVLQGHWPFNFVLSNGPLYQYAIAPLIKVSGLSYIGLKLASVVVSLLVLVATYALARVLLDERLALLSLFIAAVSSWLLIFSRLGNSQILVPLLTASTTCFAVRATRGGYLDIVCCAIIAALGVYTYPQNFILPPVIFITLVCLWWLKTGINWRQLLLFALITLVCVVPFALIVLKDFDSFSKGYIGEKLPASGELLTLLPGNLLRGLLALHGRGDEVFRSNPASLPHLDILSGLLFLLGVLFWLQPQRWRLSVALFIPLLLLQLPSMLVRYPQQVPSASRTLGITPMVYILVASGLWWLLMTLGKLPWLRRLILLVVLLDVCTLNAQRYFLIYPAGLPNRNTPFGRIIASYITGLPPTTEVFVVGCCWGQWEQPHAKSILYELHSPHTLTFLDPKEPVCDALLAAPRPLALIWNPADTELAPQLAACAGAGPPTLYTTANGDQIFQVIYLAQ